MFKDLLLPAITCAVTGATLTADGNRRGRYGGILLCKLTSSLPPAPVKPGGSCTRLPSTLLLPSSKCSVHLRNSAIVSLEVSRSITTSVSLTGCHRRTKAHFQQAVCL